jgi:hypothetical protein
MSMTAILVKALKSLPWRTIATVAMERAPELYQKARARSPQTGATPCESAVEMELQARVADLQKLLLEQKGLNREQEEKSVLLAKRCAALEARLLSWQVIAGALFIAALILLVIALR